ncbi:MAG: DUF2835 domain-containing protein [Thioalkalispiraceae bacterium]|jgi:hypothetical protein
MNCVRFHLQIAADDYLKYYSGQARSVSVICDDGQRIEFPAHHLREFVTSNGISGYFELSFDENHRFKQLILIC